MNEAIGRMLARYKSRTAEDHVQALREILLAAPVKEAVAVVDDGQRIEGIEIPRPERAPGFFGGRPADAFGTHPRPRRVRHGLIEAGARQRRSA